MNDDARLGGEFGTRHLPMGGDVIEEHGAHCAPKVRRTVKKPVTMHAFFNAKD
jgi:hypothetical protein